MGTSASPRLPTRLSERSSSCRLRRVSISATTMGRASWSSPASTLRCPSCQPVRCSAGVRWPLTSAAFWCALSSSRWIWRSSCWSSSRAIRCTFPLSPTTTTAGIWRSSTRLRRPAPGPGSDDVFGCTHPCAAACCACEHFGWVRCSI